MDLSKFTERSRGFIQAAQTIAMRENHQRLVPLHLLKALMDDPEGLASNLIKRAGGAPERVTEALSLAMGKLPKVTGDAAQVYLDNTMARVLDEAQKIATKAGDSFIVAYNSDGSADNRNGSALLALNSTQILGDGNQTYQDVYGQLAEKVGILTSQGRINQGAGESMLRQSMDAMQSMSGVNLEEEAAKLIQLEQHYNASARLITLARDLFDTLLRI